MQLDLFPTYPRLSPADLPTPTHDWRQDWKLFDYPSEDIAMGQTSEQSALIIYLANVIDAVLASMQQPYFTSTDIFVYYTKQVASYKKGKKSLKTKKYVLAPDVFIAKYVEGGKRASFIKEKEQERLGSDYDQVELIAIEVLSESNYKKRIDQKTRFDFYNGLGVKEYIVVHTQPELSLEVFWRLGDTLQRVMYYDSHFYKTEVLGVTFQIDNGILTLLASDGTPFMNYGDEHETRLEAEKKLAEIYEAYLAEKDALIEETKAFEEAEKARTEAEKARTEAEERANELEIRAKEEQIARMEAEEKNNALLFELEELRNLLRVQKQYE